MLCLQLDNVKLALQNQLSTGIALVVACFSAEPGDISYITVSSEQLQQEGLQVY